MELNHLRYFYEVALAGSFTKAARSMRISQSAISKIVALLEAREGIILLHRNKSGVELTGIGAEVFAKCEGIFGKVSEIESLCRGFQETCEGNLRLGASDHIANYLLAPAVQKMRTQYPRLLTSIFSATPNDVLELILKNELELGISFSKVNLPGIHYEALGPIEMAIVCHPKHIPPGHWSLSLDKLSDTLNRAGFISSIRRHYSRHPSQRLFELLGKDPAVSFESSSQETQKRLCLGGGGFAFLARFMVEEELRKKSLVEIPLKTPLTENLLLARKKSAPLSFNAKTFLKAQGWDL